MQTLTAIDIRNIKKTEKHEIKIPAHLKTSGYQKLQPNLILPFYLEDFTVCVARALEIYLNRTGHLRNKITCLFILWKKPYNTISTQSLNRWIKKVLEESGIDSSTFTTYSTRHAATSMTKHRGISIDLIKKQWAGHSHHRRLHDFMTKESWQETMILQKLF